MPIDESGVGCEPVNRVLESNHSKVGFVLLADTIDVKYQDVTHCSLQEIGTKQSPQPLANGHHHTEEQPSQNEDQ